MPIPAETTNDNDSVKSIVLELNRVLDANSMSVRFVKDLILNLAIKLEHLGTPSRLISARIKQILREKITQGKITARWPAKNSEPSFHMLDNGLGGCYSYSQILEQLKKILCNGKTHTIHIRATGYHSRWTFSFFDLEVMKPSKQAFQSAKIIIPSCDPSSVISPQQDVMDWAGVEPATFRLRIEHYYH